MKPKDRPRLIPRAYDYDEDGRFGPVDPDSLASNKPGPEAAVLAGQVLTRAQNILTSLDYWIVLLDAAGFNQQETASHLYKQALVTSPIAQSTVSRRLNRALDDLGEDTGLTEDEVRACIVYAIQQHADDWAALLPVKTPITLN